MTPAPRVAPTVPLSDGGAMPAIGYGTWPLDDAHARAAVGEALRIGYRLVDTAAKYGNEVGVGRAIAESDVPRDRIFVTTKLRGAQHGYAQAQRALDESLRRLGLDHVDLFLIHWPLPDLDLYVDSWRALVDLQKDGRTRSIGVSNFTARHIERLLAETGVAPAVNQVELHPDFAQPQLRAWHAQHGIVTESWSPLGRDTDVLAHPAIAAVAERQGRTPAQVVLRWHVQIGAVPIPKSADPGRMRENLEALDIELSDADVAELATVDRGNRVGGDPDTNVEL
jgi:2,5-diketo-D-gluconate reductase A